MGQVASRLNPCGSLRTHVNPVVPTLPLFLFTVDAAVVAAADEAGVCGFVVDWDFHGKHARQHGVDTQINRHTFADLQRVRHTTTRQIICRLNPLHDGTPDEISRAIDGGADELLLPMARSVDHVVTTLSLVALRRPLGVLIETVGAVADAAAIGALPLARVYLGLHDLALDRTADRPLEALTDGTLERVRRVCPHPFSVAGVTRPACGVPIPGLLLLAELARLGAGFAFLRRSFLRDVAVTDFAPAIRDIQTAWQALCTRSAEAIEADRLALRTAIAHAPSHWRRG